MLTILNRTNQSLADLQRGFSFLSDGVALLPGWAHGKPLKLSTTAVELLNTKLKS